MTRSTVPNVRCSGSKATLFTVFAASFLSFTSAVYATEVVYSPRYSTCMDRSGGVTYEMLDCINAELKSQDAALNTNYKVLTSQLTPSRRKQLLEAQRAWLRFRDTNCQFYADPDGGSLATIEANSCVLSMTAARAQELNQLAQR
jgi:uncharacterized protein YecT (DUF1311 family)